MISNILSVVLENSGTEVIIRPRNYHWSQKILVSILFSIHIQMQKNLLNTANGQSLILNATTYIFAFNPISN